MVNLNLNYRIYRIYKKYKKHKINNNYKNNKKDFYIKASFSLFSVFLFSFSTLSAAWGDPQLVSKINSAFESIESWILKLATPAAAVAVGSGVFMKKFSFGDEERMRMGKKIIKSSLFSYAFILAIDLILSAIKSLIS